MSGHRVSWAHYGDTIDGTIHCDAPDWSPCRIACSRGCDSWGDVSDDGRFHATGNLTDTTHAMEVLSHCNVVEFIGDAGLVEGYDGPDVAVHDGPIEPVWDGDTYLWRYAEATP